MITKEATLALIVRDGQILLGHKIRKGADIGEGTLNGPGGKVEPGQSIHECLETEVYDEVGLRIRAEESDKVAVIEFHIGVQLIFRVHVFLVRNFSGEPTSSNEMEAPTEGWWFRVDDLPFDRMLVSDRDWIPKALTGIPFRANIFQNDDGSALLKPIEYLQW